MNSDDDVDSLNPAGRRPNLIVVNHHGASREQLPATENQVLAGEASDVEDEVVETSDNEELALDLALQRPSYWLAPSLYPPIPQATDQKRLCFSQRAVESSSVQPSPVRSISYTSRFIRYTAQLSTWITTFRSPSNLIRVLSGRHLFPPHYRRLALPLWRIHQHLNPPPTSGVKM